MAADVTTTTRHQTPGTAGVGAVLAGVLRGQRRSLVLWSIAVAAVCGFYIAFYPAIGDEQMEVMADMLPPDLAAAIGYDQLGDAAGYLSATVFGLLGPALLLVFGIGVGARLLAGDEEDGTLELELTHPVERRAVYLERLGSLWVGVVLLALAAGAVSVLLSAVLDLDVAIVGIAAGTVGLLLLAGAHATVAFAVGAITGRRAVGLAAGAGLAVVGYIADAVGPMADVDWLSAVSPWAWFLGNDPLREGFDLGGLALLIVLALVAAVAGAVRYERRDLGV